MVSFLIRYHSYDTMFTKVYNKEEKKSYVLHAPPAKCSKDYNLICILQLGPLRSLIRRSILI